jgi:threonine dehydrogenase-like Zn-dependent dehydrogenase
MRAAVVAAPGHIEIAQAPIPEPKTGEVRVRLDGCGVCASNLPPWEGREWFSYPMAPGNLGHEGWGTVDALGENVVDFAIGERVAVLSQNAYAEYDLADASSAVVKLPDTLGDQPFPAEPLGCAINIFKRSGIEAGQTVAIVGIGFLGALLTRLCANAGARVLAIARRPFALDVARAQGASEVIPMDDHWRIIERVKELTNGAMCPVVIECVGKQWPLDLAGELTGTRGRLVVAGYHQDGPRQVNMQQWNWKGLDVINAHERDPLVYKVGMQSAVQAVADGTLDPRPLFTHTFGLDELDQALNITRERPDGFLKALVINR